MLITYIIIALTAGISILALGQTGIAEKFRFNAFLVKHNNQWYRFFTYGFIHADTMHLLVNVFVLYSFGRISEPFYHYYFGAKGLMNYALLYLGGLLFSVLYSYKKNKDHFEYNAVGASGAVAAVLFASIVFYPLGRIYLFFIPIGIPSFVFGILYLLYSAYMAKRNVDNIGHDAHFWGALFGFVFTLILKPQLFIQFLDQIKSQLF